MQMSNLTVGAVFYRRGSAKQMFISRDDDQWRQHWMSGGRVQSMKATLNVWRMCAVNEGNSECLEDVYSQWRQHWISGGCVQSMKAKLNVWRMCVVNGGTTKCLEDVCSQWRQHWMSVGCVKSMRQKWMSEGRVPSMKGTLNVWRTCTLMHSGNNKYPMNKIYNINFLIS